MFLADQAAYVSLNSRSGGVDHAGLRYHGSFRQLLITLYINPKCLILHPVRERDAGYPTRSKTIVTSLELFNRFFSFLISPGINSSLASGRTKREKYLS